MDLFVSYTRPDDTAVRALKDDLEKVGHNVWFDHEIHGGERWWAEIIQQIETCDVFVFALSKDSLKSQPCRAELRYADDLWVPVLPVQIAPVDNLRIPVGEKQVIDYRDRDADAALRLVSAVVQLGSQVRRRPDPLPAPPPVPFEYVYRLARQIEAIEITREDQLTIISEFDRRLQEERDVIARKDLLNLLADLKDRPEITRLNADRIDKIIEAAGRENAAAEPGATRLPPAAHWPREKLSRATPPPAASPQAAAGRADTPRADTGRAGTPRVDTPRADTGRAGTPPRGERVVPPETSSTERPAEGSSFPRPGQKASTPTEHPQAGPSAEKAADSTTSAVPAWLRGRAPGPRLRRGPAEPPRGPSPAGPDPRRAQSDPGGAQARNGGAGLRTSWWQEPKESTKPAAEPAEPAETEHVRALERPAGEPSGGKFAFSGAVLGGMGLPFVLLGFGSGSATVVPVVATLLLLTGALGLSMSVVAMSKGEHRSRTAVVVAVLGLLGAIAYAFVAGMLFTPG